MVLLALVVIQARIELMVRRMLVLVVSGDTFNLIKLVIFPFSFHVALLLVFILLWQY